MKNLFSINKTDDKHADRFDDTPYLAARVSEAIQAKLKNAFSVLEDEYVVHEPTEEEKALKKKGDRYWLLCVACFFAAVALFFGGNKLGLYDATPYLHILDMGLLVAAIVFNVMARKIARRQTAVGTPSVAVDFSKASKLLEEAAADASKELGVPRNAVAVDVLPFHYIIKNGERKPAGKKNRFDNISVSVYIQNNALCIATAQELFRIPLNDIRGYRAYDEDFEIDMWLKSEEHDSDKYAEYGIRKCGLMGRRGHGYVGLDIDGTYEVLIPCYDVKTVKTLLPITEIP